MISSKADWVERQAKNRGAEGKPSAPFSLCTGFSGASCRAPSWPCARLGCTGPSLLPNTADSCPRAGVAAQRLLVPLLVQQQAVDSAQRAGQAAPVHPSQAAAQAVQGAPCLPAVEAGPQRVPRTAHPAQLPLQQSSAEAAQSEFVFGPSFYSPSGRRFTRVPRRSPLTGVIIAATLARKSRSVRFSQRMIPDPALVPPWSRRSRPRSFFMESKSGSRFYVFRLF